MGERLIDKLDHSLPEILHYDFYIAIAGAAGGIYLSLHSTATLKAETQIAIGIVGVVIGAVIAGMAVVAAFMDSGFIRKIHAIGKTARRYVTPFAFTAALGVVAGLLLILLTGLPVHAPEWLRVTTSGLSGFFTVWTIASVLPLLKLTIDFVDLKGEAAKIPDDAVGHDNVHKLPERNADGG